MRGDSEDAVQPPPTSLSLVTCRYDHTPMDAREVRREQKRSHARKRTSKSPTLAGALPFLVLLPITLLHGTQQ